MSQQSRKEWVSNLRVKATISVILLHVAATVLYKYNQVSESTWWIGNIYDSLVRFSVPVFLMVTGALLLGKPEPYDSFLKKKFIRIILPFAFWTGIYIVYNFIEPSPFSTRGAEQSDISWIFQQIKEGSSYHLWYIYVLVGLYLILPVVSSWVSKTSKRNIEYFLIIWVVILSIYSADISEENYGWDIRYYFGYLGYVVLGYYLSIISTKRRNGSIIALFLFVVGSLITIIGTYQGTSSQGSFYNYFYAYLTPNVLLMSVGIFLFFKNWTPSLKGFFATSRDFIDKHSFGVYLSHVLVLNYLTKLDIDWYLIHPAIGIPLTTIICLVISIALVFVLRLIPFGKYIVG